MDWTLEVVVLPVGDLDRSIAFYRDQVGFHLDHDTRTEHMHVAQLTPPGSGCSIVVGDLLREQLLLRTAGRQPHDPKAVRIRPDHVERLGADRPGRPEDDDIATLAHLGILSASLR